MNVQLLEDVPTLVTIHMEVIIAHADQALPQVVDIVMVS